MDHDTAANEFFATLEDAKRERSSIITDRLRAALVALITDPPRQAAPAAPETGQP